MHVLSQLVIRSLYSHIHIQYIGIHYHYTCFSLLSFYLSPTDGQLRHIKTGEPFVFNAREDLHRWNQKRYEALGEVMHNSGQPCSATFASSTGSIRIFCSEQFL